MQTRTVFGHVDRDGNILSGSGDFTIHNHHSPGKQVFVIAFNQPFLQPPTVVASLASTNPWDAEYETDRYSEPSQGCVVGGIFPDHALVFYVEEALGFSFIAIGLE
ncbi:MAG: hypothetical protein QNJ42_20230 [Crocosphaera sp.]|nr:hypothetical protein [Crocosphaera sp.]